MTWSIQERKAMTERYIKGEAAPEERALYEERLLSDDSLLELYMEALSRQDGLPDLPDPALFADRVMNHEKIKPYPRRAAAYASDRPKRWYEKAIVHYAIAASVTLLFLFTGAFERLQSVSPEQGAPLSQSPSYSDQLVEKTSGWIDSLLPK
ncbi:MULTISPECIES: hypothetical protein [Paenibacillus]|uniref:Uncharacterized protein n=1 Tax=Paenibacillus lactis 154 TaxID=743719 RepID=G4HFE5_9BACL|nr:hypothetical protein [Paenibacillus lactis]EHB64462.1 hypothetical protein PaelaDRAFT_2706 [Paenibacillus lactis 154]GIO91782.1 hypothetical protein J31TS3_30090 [Paenibacillus lactis]